MNKFALSTILVSLLLTATVANEIKADINQDVAKLDERKLVDVLKEFLGDSNNEAKGKEVSTKNNELYRSNSYIRGASSYPSSGSSKGISHELMIIFYALCAVVGIFTIAFLKFAFDLVVSIEDVRENKDTQYLIREDLPESLETL